jgi:murein DD-endopeptidase MepM/ murein hydrolase activator NlpD
LAGGATLVVVRPRTIYRLSAVLVIVLCAVVSVVVIARRDQGSTPRPLFQLPFPCRESWRMTTYAGHDDYDIDFFFNGGPTGGREVVASAAGKVHWAGWGATLATGEAAPPGAVGTRSGLGFGVIIDHGGGWFTSYGHLAAWPAVGRGDRVTQGQLLGHVGHTGATTIDHLHYEQHDDRRDRDHTRGVGDKVESYFNGVPSGITSDGSERTGPLFVAGPVSPHQDRTSQNCGPASVPAVQPPDG